MEEEEDNLQAPALEGDRRGWGWGREWAKVASVGFPAPQGLFIRERVSSRP